VRRGFLDVPEWHAGIEGGGDERRSECGLMRLSIPARFASRRTIRAEA
jgi:hypothetical protein